MAREERVCKECESSEIEDAEHWLLRCEAWKSHREPLLVLMQEHQEADDDNLAAFLYYPLHVETIKLYL